MPALQYVQTNNDPSVAESLSFVANVIKDATQTALRNQLLQLQVQHGQMELTTTALRNKLLEQSFQQNELENPLKLQQMGGEIQNQQIRNQYAGPLAMQNLEQGQQQLQLGGQQQAMNEQRLQQETMQTNAMPQQINEQHQMLAEQIKQAKVGSKVADMKAIEHAEEFQDRSNSRQFKSSLGKAIADLLPPDAGKRLKDAYDLYGPLMTDQLLGTVGQFANTAIQQAYHNQELEVQKEHFDSMGRAQDAKLKNQILLAAMKSPQVLARAKAMYPDDPFLAGMDAAPQSEFKNMHEVAVWAAQQDDPKVREGAIALEKWTGKIPEKLQYDQSTYQNIKVPDMEAFEAEKGKIKKVFDALAKRRAEAEQGKPEQKGTAPTAKQTEQTQTFDASKLIGEGTQTAPYRLLGSQEEADAIKRGEFKGKWVLTPNGALRQL